MKKRNLIQRPLSWFTIGLVAIILGMFIKSAVLGLGGIFFIFMAMLLNE